MPLEVSHAHLLTATIVDSAKDIDAIVVVLSAMEESRERHRCKLDELQSLKVEDHGVLRARTVVMTAQYDDFVSRDKNCSFGFDREWELDE